MVMVSNCACFKFGENISTFPSLFDCVSTTSINANTSGELIKWHLGSENLCTFAFTYDTFAAFFVQNMFITFDAKITSPISSIISMIKFTLFSLILIKSSNSEKAFHRDLSS